MNNPAQNMVEVDFVVLKEDYSRFQVEDGTILRAKIVLRKIFKTPTVSPQGYPLSISMDTFNAVSALVPNRLRGKPSNEVVDVTKEVGKELKVEPQEEKIQEYMTSDGFRITLKPVVLKVFRFPHYNNFGEPVYFANMQAITNIDKTMSTGT